MRKKARSDLRAPLSEFTVKDSGSYGVQLCVHQHGVPIGKFSLLTFPHVSCPAPTAAGLLCPFIFPFLSSLSTHERFTSRVKDTRPPVLYRDGSSGHDTVLHMEFLVRFDSDPLRIRDTYDTSILLEETRSRRQNWLILRSAKYRWW